MNPKIPMDASTSDANKHTNIPGSPSRTFGLAVGAVLVVLFPQQLGQDELVLLVQLLRLLPARARRHRGGVDAGSSRAGRAGGRAAGRAGGRRGRSYSAGKRRPRRLEKEGRRRRRRRRQRAARSHPPPPAAAAPPRRSRRRPRGPVQRRRRPRLCSQWQPAAPGRRLPQPPGSSATRALCDHSGRPGRKRRRTRRGR